MDFIRIINKVYCKVHFVFRIMYIHLLENLIKTVSDIKIVHVFLSTYWCSKSKTHKETQYIQYVIYVSLYTCLLQSLLVCQHVPRIKRITG